MKDIPGGQWKILQEVLSLPTAPLHEEYVIEYVKNFAHRLGLACVEDIYGNIVIEYRHGPFVPPIGLCAHTDHPGFVVEGMENGRIRMAVLGGAAIPNAGDSLVLYGGKDPRQVTVETIVSKIENDEGDRTAAPAGKPKTEVRYLLASGQELSSPQGFAMHDLIPCELRGEMVYGRAIDDLAGCAAMLTLMELLSVRRPVAHAYFIFTRAEEIGFVGACGLALSGFLAPKLPIISLEASKKLPGAEQGKGVVVRIGDRRSIFHSAVTSFIIQTAEGLSSRENDFLFQKRVLDGGTCESSLFGSFGYPSSGMAVPLGCYHNTGENSPVEPEYIHLDDWRGMVRLLWAIISGSEKLTAWEENQRAYFMKRFEKFRGQIIRHNAPDI